jgi:hypothetical protein
MLNNFSASFRASLDISFASDTLLEGVRSFPIFTHKPAATHQQRRARFASRGVAKENHHRASISAAMLGFQFRNSRLTCHVRTASSAAKRASSSVVSSVRR